MILATAVSAQIDGFGYGAMFHEYRYELNIDLPLAGSIKRFCQLNLEQAGLQTTDSRRLYIPLVHQKRYENSEENDEVEAKTKKKTTRTKYGIATMSLHRKMG